MNESANRGHDGSPYHSGERMLHERLGIGERQELLGRRMIRSHMPDQHRDFFARLSFLVTGSVDESGAPWASLLFGAPGFVSTPDPVTLKIDAEPVSGDPLGGAIAVGAPISFLGIEPHTRRRNRVNAIVGDRTERGFSARVVQSFGNCPQYIRARMPDPLSDPATPREPQAFTILGGEETALIRGADTFFVASHNPVDEADGVGGVDVNHRGGKAGFVRVEGNTLTIPDFKGNNAFNTLGNFVVNPRAGITLFDPLSSDLLLLTGDVDLLWDGNTDTAAFAGAQRAWRMTVSRGLWLRGASPLRWLPGPHAPTTEATGNWPQ